MSDWRDTTEPEKPDPKLPPAHASDREYVQRVIDGVKKRLAEKGARKS